MNCPNCGAYNNGVSNSCINCGANLNIVQQNNNVNYQNNQQLNNNQSNVVNKKSNTYLKFIPIIGVVLVAIIVCSIFISKKDKTKLSEFDVNYSNAFFISNGSNYALFNNDGKQLTDFTYSYVDEFINNTALVKSDGKYGVINSKGKMVVELGKYTYISSEAGLYIVTDSMDHEYLINGKGKVLYDMDNKELKTFSGVDMYSILVDNTDNKYKLLNYEGKVLVQFTKNSSDEEPSTNEEDNYITIFYNNKNYVFNAATSKKVVSFDSDVHYCVNAVEEEGKYATFNSCDGSSSSNGKYTYKYIKDGKLYDLNDKCDKVKYSSKNLICEKDYKKYLIYSNNKVGIDLSDKAFVNNDTYATNNKETNSVDFYEKGKVVKSVECMDISRTGYSENGIYVLETSYGSKCNTSYGIHEYYKSNGTKAFEGSFKSASEFNEDGVAIVSEDGKKYYLINKKGKKISNEYEKISGSKDFYKVENDDLEGIIDKSGKEIVKVDYSDIEIRERRNIKYAILEGKDSKYSVMNLNNKKVLVTSDNELKVTSNYIYDYNDGKTKYYTLKGKLFYER